MSKNFTGQIACMTALVYAVSTPRVHALIVAKTKKQVVADYLGGVNGLAALMVEAGIQPTSLSTNEIKLVNGSSIRFTYPESDSQILSSYAGCQFEYIFVDEHSEISDYGKDFLKSRTRSNKGVVPMFVDGKSSVGRLEIMNKWDELMAENS